jgi:hypothetical protein
VNFIVAQFVVTPDVRAKDLQWLLWETPAHVVIMSIGAVASDEQRQTMTEMAKDVVGGCGEAQWFGAGAALSRKGRVQKAECLSTLHQEGRESHYESFRFEMIPGYMSPKAAVAVGVVYSDPGEFWSSEFVRDAATTIKDDNVRFVACMLGGMKSPHQVEELCGGPDGPTPFFQPWRKARVAEGQARVAENQNAVASRWGLMPWDVRNFIVHPACLVLRGRAQDISEV